MGEMTELQKCIEAERSAEDAYHASRDDDAETEDYALGTMERARAATDEAVKAVEVAVTHLSRYAGHLETCACCGDAEEDCTCGYVDAWNGVFSRQDGVGLKVRGSRADMLNLHRTSQATTGGASDE